MTQTQPRFYKEHRFPNYYGPGGGLIAAAGLGQQASPPPASSSPMMSQGVHTLWWVAGTASTAALAYHGYRRNNSIGWALVWALFGGLFWPVSVPIALAQGFGVRKPERNGRKSRKGGRRRH